MFKQLKRKMLGLNLTILTVLLIAIFSTLYLTNQRQINNQINLELSRVMNNYNESFPQENPNLPPILNNEPLPERSISFIIVKDINDQVVNAWYSFNNTDETLQDATQYAIDDTGRFELNDSYWAYIKLKQSDVTVYAFVDITSQQNYLSNMVWTFVIVFFVSFVIVYFLSSYFSNQSINKIKEAFDKQKEFIANASHELKTPLAIISTNADILIEEQSDNKWLNNIKYETERMNQLTKDLLYLTKMSENHPNKMNIQKTNISELVESSVLSFEALAYDKKVKLDYQIEPSLYANVDKNQLSQVFHILMDNAIKYVNHKGMIKVGIEKNHHYILYSISNTGEGIKRKDLDKIFDRFYMGDESRSANEKSYGLGLSIAKSIVENHEGKIWCHSEEKKQTTFTVKLKLVN